MLLTLTNVHFAYPGGAPVLSGVDFTLPEPSGGNANGQPHSIGLIGSNGAGKTTLLHLMLGLLAPTGGELRFRGQRVNGPDSDKALLRSLRKEIGFLFQDSDDQLFCPTVLEDVAFGPLNHGASQEEARALAEESLARLGLVGYGDRITHRLSGGEKRLVALATLLAMRPTALILDEPTTGLDPETREHLVEVVNGLTTSTLIVSHDFDFLSRTTNAVHALRRGVVCRETLAVLHEHVHAHPHGDLPHTHDPHAPDHSPDHSHEHPHDHTHPHEPSYDANAHPATQDAKKASA